MNIADKEEDPHFIKHLANLRSYFESNFNLTLSNLMSKMRSTKLSSFKIILIK